ncbi:hypothetical protein ACHAWF_004426 [Thalassiosira exigua]
MLAHPNLNRVAIISKGDAATLGEVLFLDGVEQSNLYGNVAYHEALIVPAMLAHPNLKPVTIISER